MRTDSPIVVALGGNAISRPGEQGNVEQQFANTRHTCTALGELVAAGAQLLITHGNGPQVGNVLRRVELAAHELYRLPLHICGAHTQGGMGFMIAVSLENELYRRGLNRNVTALVSSVRVDPNDPAFQNPTKPIGGFYPRDKADALRAEYGWTMVEDPKHGFRRVVPSPRPISISEIRLIARLADEGELLVVAGGGGIPVMEQPNGDYAGMEAVIDKDRTAGLLARQVNAATLLIGTNVERVAVNYGQPGERFLERMTVSEAQRWYDAGQFPPGSMGPKVEAALEFLAGTERVDAVAIICDTDKMVDALADRSGTWIVKDN
jgi:carbamate kinase